MSKTYTLYSPQQAHRVLLDVWQLVKSMLMAGHRMQVTVRKEKRSLSQNSRMWAMLSEVSTQVDWHGNKLSPNEWKDVFTAGLKRQKVVPGIDGGFVVLGSSTSEMTKEELSEMIEFIYAFGAQKGVQFAE